LIEPDRLSSSARLIWLQWRLSANDQHSPFVDASKFHERQTCLVLSVGGLVRQGQEGLCTGCDRWTVGWIFGSADDQVAAIARRDETPMIGTEISYTRAESTSVPNRFCKFASLPLHVCHDLAQVFRSSPLRVYGVGFPHERVKLWRRCRLVKIIMQAIARNLAIGCSVFNSGWEGEGEDRWIYSLVRVAVRTFATKSHLHSSTIGRSDRCGDILASPCIAKRKEGIT
jgi:hypothetical protein